MFFLITFDVLVSPFQYFPKIKKDIRRTRWGTGSMTLTIKQENVITVEAYLQSLVLIRVRLVALLWRGFIYEEIRE
jgi:hypothetical protein